MTEAELRRVVQNCLAAMAEDLRRPVHSQDHRATRGAEALLRAFEREGLMVVEKEREADRLERYLQPADHQW